MMDRSAAPRWLAPALWSVYLIWPVAGWGWFGGVWNGPASLVGLALLWVTWATSRVRWSASAAAVCVLLKLTGGGLVVERGLTASYFANERLEGSPEPGVGYGYWAGPRLERELDFGADAGRDLPLFFFNDFLRFNFYQPHEPARRLLPFSAEWAGQYLVDESGPVVVFARGAGIDAAIEVDGIPAVSLRPGSEDARASLTLAAGWHALHVRLAAPYGADRRFYAGMIDRTGIDHPFGEQQVYRRRQPPWRVPADHAARTLSAGVDVLAVILLVVGLARALSRPGAARAHAIGWTLAGVAVVADAAQFARPFLDRVVLLDGGSDMLTYETYARDILQHGPLMTLGHPVGAGEAFYYQPLYPYVLALMHLVTGDGLFGVVLLQRLLIPLSVVLVWRITAALFGERLGWCGLGSGVVFLYGSVGHWAGVLLGEIVFIPLVALFLWRLVVLAQSGSAAGAWSAGVAGGFATLSRSTLLLAWPAVAGASVLAARRGHRRRVATALMVGGAMVIALATARNWIVSRTFVPVTTSFAVNVQMGNTPPRGVSIPEHPATQHLLVRWLRPDDRTRSVIEFAIHAPRPFLAHLRDKALYTLGSFGALEPSAPTRFDLMVVWITALLGLAWCGVRAARGQGGGAAVLYPALLAATHFASVVVIFPNVYGDRLILPFYVLLLPYVAAACGWVVPDRSA